MDLETAQIDAPIQAPAPAPTSPVMAQYFEAKSRQPGALLFFRMGDFYELFFDDAAKAAAALGIALTSRGVHAGEPIVMAGVPAHSVDAYIARLIRSGFNVAVVDQMEAPAEARKRGSKAVVRRELVRVVTPGTLTEDSLLDPRGANRLVAVAQRGGQIAIASAEISTGDVECLPLSSESLAGALAGLRPSEILVPDRLLADAAISRTLKATGAPVEPLASALSEPAAAAARVRRLYGVAALDGFGALTGAEVAALALIAAHLEATQAGRRLPLRPPRRGMEGDTLAIDPSTRASLEIDRTLGGRRDGSLLAAIDRTVTGPGARLLAARLAQPLRRPAAINTRLDAVAWFVEHAELRAGLRAGLAGAGDMARALSRLCLGRGGPRDLGVLRDGLATCERLAMAIDGDADPFGEAPAEIASAASALRSRTHDPLSGFREQMRSGLAAELPVHARDGGFVAPGVDDDLDAARALRDDSRRVVASLERRLADEAGAPLKIRHNAVLGYFVETAPRHAEPMMRPPLSGTFIHRQTLAGATRFTTVELAELDSAIARAASRALALEHARFEAWREQALALSGPILAAAEALAALDVAAAQAEWAVEIGAVRPLIDDGVVFEAVAARHPVVEAAVRRDGDAFTANDCALDGEGAAGARLIIVTGPNMAGKSTFLRQNALLIVLAQAGSFVPARSLRLGVVDRLFSRVGAGDDLARGRSTFLTEMVETAAILTQATERSFVILDEIGRGTATWDGLAIAWACAEALHEANRCRALFATHYHELAELEQRLAHVSNLSMRVREWNGELVFLHEAAPGCADRSYGVQVAKLAGIPAPVVARAQQVLARLEGDGNDHASLSELPLFSLAEPSAPTGPSAAETALAALDPDGMSPREALDALFRLKGML